MGRLLSRRFLGVSDVDWGFDCWSEGEKTLISSSCKGWRILATTTQTIGDFKVELQSDRFTEHEYARNSDRNAQYERNGIQMCCDKIVKCDYFSRNPVVATENIFMMM